MNRSDLLKLKLKVLRRKALAAGVSDTRLDEIEEVRHYIRICRVVLNRVIVHVARAGI